MSIGKNIAKFRKAKNLTQEELGCKLGVTNQAVSKWESETYLPDVLLLPEIASALDVSLNALYGIEEDGENRRVRADDFPEAAFQNLRRFFYDNSIMRFKHIGPSDDDQLAYQAQSLANGSKDGCISNTNGAVILTNDLAFIDRSYKAPDSEKIFDSARAAKNLKALSDKNVRKVFAYQYKTTFEKIKAGETSDREFFADEIAKECGLGEEEAEDALNALAGLYLNERHTDRESHKEIYIFDISNALFALNIFKLAEMLADDHVWHIIRDSSMISDYAFLS